jgi:DNA gyrase subunit A
MLITDGGKLIRMRVAGIPTMGRNTQGVRLMGMSGEERVVSVARLAEREDGSDSVDEPTQPANP